MNRYDLAKPEENGQAKWAVPIDGGRLDGAFRTPPPVKRAIVARGFLPHPLPYVGLPKPTTPAPFPQPLILTPQPSSSADPPRARWGPARMSAAMDNSPPTKPLPHHAQHATKSRGLAPKGPRMVAPGANPGIQAKTKALSPVCASHPRFLPSPSPFRS